MSDEQEHRRDPARGGSEPDETRQFSPFDDDDDRTPETGNHPDGGTRSSDAYVFDNTGPMPRTGQTPPLDGDETVLTPRPDATSVMPAATAGTQEEWNGAWAGRAEVRPPRPGREEYTRTEWTTAVPPEPRGKWWMPIVVGIVGLLLLAAIGWGIYLIAQNADDTDTPPATTPSAVAPASTVPTTTEPTTTPPTTTPTTTEPAQVTVPALVGLSQQEAQQALDRRGLAYRLIFRRSDATAGTVIDSDPGEGQEVPADTQVTLVIAAQPTTQATPTTTATTPDGQPDED
jgi:hypothetical protein